MIKVFFSLALVVFVTESYAADVAFRDSHRRVLGTTDLTRFLLAKLQLDSNSPGSNCDFSASPKMIVTGALSPLEKKSVMEKPGPDYFEVYLQCVKTLVSTKAKVLYPENSGQWTSLKDSQKSQLLEKWLGTLVGPQIALNELSYIGPQSVYPGRPRNIAEFTSYLLTLSPKGEDQSVSLSEAFQFYSYAILSNPLILEM